VAAAHPSHIHGVDVARVVVMNTHPNLARGRQSKVSTGLEHAWSWFDLLPVQIL